MCVYMCVSVCAYKKSDFVNANMMVCMCVCMFVYIFICM
jgi:hypothetical protein